MPRPPITSTLYGKILLTRPPDFPSSPDYSVSVDSEEFTSDTDARILHAMGGQENEERTHTFSFSDRVDLENFITFLKTVRGKWGAFWMPSWADDFYVLYGDMFTLTVKWCGYSSFLLPANTHRRIIVLRNSNIQTIWGRLVGSAVDNGDGTETINGTIDFPYDLSYSNLPSANGHRHMYLHMCRLVDDSVQVKHFGREDAEVTIKVVTIPEEGQ